MIENLVGQILFLMACVVLGALLNKLIKLELTLASLTAGVLAGLALPYLNFDTGIRADNLKEIVFYLILPVLIFNAAWELNVKLFKRWLVPILILAVPGILISCGVLAVILYVAIGDAENFPWIAALLCGAILAATDPVAVISQLRKMGAPEELTTLFEGESLFNDATAVVLFTLILGTATGMQANQSFIGYFSTLFFLGLGFGALFGLVISIVILFIGNKAMTHLLLVLSGFASFYIAEHHFHFSGILAVMTTALTCKLLLKEQETTFLADLDVSWDWLGLAFTQLLFVLMGLAIVFDMFTEQWLAMLIAIGAALVARTITIYICSWSTGFLTYPIPKNWRVPLIWGGLKGAIAVALVFSLPTDLNYWWVIQSIVFGVVCFNLIIQAPINQWLLKKSNLDR